MQQKRKKLKILICVAFVMIATIIGGGYVFGRHRSTGSSDTEYVPRIVSVDFKDGVTFKRAKDLLSSLQLELDKPDSVYENGFTPFDYRSVRTDQFDEISKKLGTYPEVTSFVDATNDGTSRAGPGHTWVKFYFRQDVTMARIIEILQSSGLGLGQTPSNPVLVSRSLSANAPIGQEDKIVSQLRHSSIVQSADRIPAGGGVDL